MKVTTGKLNNKKSEAFITACKVAADLIRKGLNPPLAIWKAAKEYGFTTESIAAEIGGWKKKAANGKQGGQV